MAHVLGTISPLLQLASRLLRLVIEAVHLLRLCFCSYALAEADITGWQTAAIGLRRLRVPCLRCRQRRRLGVGPHSIDRTPHTVISPDRRDAYRTKRHAHAA
jgi:hypothetical protein